MRSLEAAGRGLAALLAALAVLCLGFMMLITVADVVLRTLDPNWRIFGMLDYVEFSLAWLIFLAIPIAVLERRMIAVDVVDTVARPGVRRAIRGLAMLLMLGAFGLLASQIVAPALDMREWGETTLDLRLPKFWYWLAIWTGVGAAIVATLLTAPAELATNAADPSGRRDLPTDEPPERR
jgi:TRAP-type C4-dicarboxylate transport system permease small subunit